ncbi:histidine kinase-, DNA gyrase B-, and HSP90-like ATPase family protein, partial [Vibrio parahaemolyticus V-223/04]
WVTA